MVRKMAYVGFSYLTGLFFASFFGYKADFLFAGSLTIIAVSYIIFIDRKKLAVPVCMLTVAIALTVYGAYEVKVYYPILQFDGATATVEGEITDIRYYSNNKTGYTIKGKLDGISGNFGLYCDTLDCDYYDNITVTGLMSRFEDTYAFPSESYNKAQSVFLQMAEPTEVNIVSNFSVRREILHYRDYLYDTILSYLPNEEGSALVAMLCGDKVGLDNDTKTLLFRSGIGHVMSVSGMHVVIVAGFAFWILKGIRLNKWIRNAIIQILLFGFVVFAGLSDTVIRSWIMIIIVYEAELFRRKADAFNSLGIAVILLTITEPFLVRNASFMLSVAGIMGIGVFAPMVTSGIKISGFKGKVIKDFAAMLCVAVTVFPVSFLFFEEISIISPITNVLLVPFCNLALLCGFCVSLTGGVGFLAFPLLMTAGLCCKFVLFVSRFVGGFRFTYIPTGFRYIEIGIVISIFAIILSYRIFKTKKFVIFTSSACIAALLLCSILYSMLNFGTLSIAVLGDVDDSSLIIHNGGSACIINLNGGRKLGNFNQKYLRRVGIKNVKVLALNSNTQQSISAYQKRFQLFDVERILIPDDEYFLEDTKILGVTPTKINENDTEIDMGSYQIHIQEDNTVKVTYGDFSMLCVSGKTETDHSREEYSVTAIYDGGSVPLSCGYTVSLGEDVLFTDEMGGSVLITCKEDGKTRVRGIKNGSRQ